MQQLRNLQTVTPHTPIKVIKSQKTKFCISLWFFCRLRSKSNHAACTITYAQTLFVNISYFKTHFKFQISWMSIFENDVMDFVKMWKTITLNVDFMHKSLSVQCITEVVKFPMITFLSYIFMVQSNQRHKFAITYKKLFFYVVQLKQTGNVNMSNEWFSFNEFMVPSLHYQNFLSETQKEGD